MKTDKKIVNYLFLGLLLTSSIPFIIQAVAILKSNGYVLWTYEKSINGLLGQVFPYLKDLFLGILFLVCTMSLKKSEKRLYSVFVIAVIWGVISLCINGLINGYSISLIINSILAGIRSYIYLISIILISRRLFRGNSGNYLFGKFLIIAKVSLIIQSIVTFLYVINSNSLKRFGVGGYRIAGASPNSGTLGCFIIGCIIYLSVVFIKYKKINFIEMIIYNSLSLFCVFASGMRSAQIIVAMFVLINCVYKLYSIMKLNFKNVIFGVMAIIVCGGPIFYNFIIERTQRGVLMDSASMRIDIFGDMWRGNIFEVAFGRGIGFGSNTAVILGLEGYYTFDGTFTTILGQYGIIGLFVCLSVVFFFMKYMLKCSLEYSVLSYAIIITVLIIFITGNLIEQYVLLIYLVAGCILLVDNIEVSNYK